MSEHSKRKKARAMLTKAGYAAGGHMHGDKAEDAKMAKRAVREHENALHGGKHARLTLKVGGVAEGGKMKHRADRKGRGHGKGHTQVNVIVAGQHDKPVPVPVPKPVPVPVNAGGGGMPMPPPGAGAPPPMPDPAAGAGGPMGLKRGGRAKTEAFGTQRDMKGGMPDGHFKKGGRTKVYPIEDGAGGAKGRLEKAKAYGA